MKEDTEQKKNWIIKFLPVIKPYRSAMLFMILLGFLSGVADSSLPLFNRYAIEHFIALKTLDTMALFIAAYMGILLLQTAGNYICMCLSGWVEMSVDRDLRDSAFNHLQTLSFSYFNQNSVGYIHSRVMGDTGKLGMLASWRLMELIWDGSYLILILVMMFIVNARLALWNMLLVPAALILSYYFQKKLITENRKVRESNANIVGNFNEGITGARTIKTLVIEKLMSSRFNDETERYRVHAVRASHFSALFSSSVTMTSSVALSLMLFQSGRLTEERIAMIGTMSVFLSYALGMLEPIWNLIRTVSAVIEMRATGERLTALLETKPDVYDTPEVMEKYGDSFFPKKENWEELYGDIEFKNVSFRYPDGEEYVLQDFSLKIPKGSNVAIVGETGAGKTTLVNLVCRFFEPTSGQILIDGRDIKARSQLWLHSHIGYVLQTPHLFSGTVRENLRYGRVDASDEEIWDALRLVDAVGIVERINGGLDGTVGEGGGSLSLGERQLLSFARAILSDPSILVLDEATSSIDTVTEQRIQKAIRTVIHGRTSFVIAHRLSTIVQADMILAVKDGIIVEQGTHEELLKKKGYYHDLYTTQVFPE